MSTNDTDPLPLGEGVPAVMGGEATPLHATMGAPLPGAMGRPHAYPSLQDTALATVPNDYAITLEKENGDRKTIETIIGDFSPAREHSALSDWTAVVPHDDDLEEYTYDTRAWITWDGRTIFTGYCKDVDTTEKDAEAVLHGYGPGIKIDEGVYVVEFRYEQVWRAFNRLFEEVIPEWTGHVTRPPDPIVIDRFEVSGTALECIEQLADEYDWHFLIDQSRWQHIQAFKPGTFVETASWKREDSEREKSTGDYYNACYVIGERDAEEGGGYIIGYYEDEQEIEEHAARRGLSYDEARKPNAVKESIDSQREANSVARARTEEFIRNSEVTGSINVFPRLIDPGKAYPTHWDTDARAGAYSLFFDGGDNVELPTRLLRPLADAGGFAMFVRADWSDLSNNEYRILGSTTAAGDPTLRTFNSNALLLQAHNADGDRAAAGAAIDTTLTDDEWYLVHYDWQYDESTDETTIRAGVDGSINDTDSVPGQLLMPDDQLWFGEFSGAGYTGYIDRPQIFHQPLSETQYADIVAGIDIPARLVRSRYPCEEGPNNSDGLLYDAMGGRHGEINGAAPAGSPKILHTVEYSHGHGTADCTLHFRRDRSTAAEVERLKRDVRNDRQRRS